MTTQNHATPVGGEMNRSATDILDLAAHLRGFERHPRAAWPLKPAPLTTVVAAAWLRD